jgi:hypothetical protein
MLQGAAFIEPKDPASVRQSKKQIAYFEEYVTALGDLSPRDCEVLCTRVLELLGVQQPTLTQFSADEGVDFFGQLRLSEFLAPDLVTPNIEKQLSVWIVGQAKHYKASKVATFDVRELVGAVELAKAKAFSSKSDKYPELNIRASDPVFSLFMTTGKISSSTWTLLRNSGVVGMDGQMVAAFLARHGVCTSSGRFRKSDLSRWLKRSAPSVEKRVRA